ncbi:MAG: tetraacyldisaccharide 4'-kinase [Sedimentisphaerales bacterium]|nr:tetraacyldisaccharide 4'-kinase [Sedimentisphaerales bacterium]
MDQNAYRRWMAGQEQKAWQTPLFAMLRLISVGYGLAIRFRNWLYDRGWLPTYRVDVPVICIGNLTTGGTGKTPLVIRLCRYLDSRSIRYGILTRGYRSQEGKLSDEPAVLLKSCPEAKIVVNPDRVAGARLAVEQHKVEILIMDDGFQHRRLARDLDIVAIDATCPFGYGRMLPAGLLREPVSSLRRADAAVITRYDRVPSDATDKIVEQIRSENPDIAIARAIHKHTHACTLHGETLSLEELASLSIFVFCGIGNPEAFLSRLVEYGLKIVGSQIYNDHHEYTRRDFEQLLTEARETKADLLLCTQKDWHKVGVFSPKEMDINLAYLALELDFLEGWDTIEALVDAVVGKRRDE